MSQRAAFCVYSGKGVSELRMFLSELFRTMTEDMNEDDDTEYDDDYEDVDDTTPDAELETGNEGDVDEEYERTHIHNPPHSNSTSVRLRPGQNATNPSHHPEVALPRDRTVRGPPSMISPEPRPFINGRINSQTTATQAAGASRRTTARVFGQQPIIETSTSPTPSDVASNRSTGTNQSNGAFFSNISRRGSLFAKQRRFDA